MSKKIQLIFDLIMLITARERGTQPTLLNSKLSIDVAQFELCNELEVALCGCSKVFGFNIAKCACEGRRGLDKAMTKKNGSYSDGEKQHSTQTKD